MFHAIHNWARIDDSGLGRPKLASGSSEKTSSMAEPMCLLSLVHEMEDTVDDDDIESLMEIRTWCVQEIFKHLQRGGTRILENVSADGHELHGGLFCPFLEHQKKFLKHRDILFASF